MFGKRNFTLITKEYNDIIEEKAKIDDEIANLQREKDLKLDKINKDFERKISVLLNKKDELELIINNSKEYYKKH